jgi:hypothetical protein
VILCIDPFLPLVGRTGGSNSVVASAWSRAVLSIRGRTPEAINALQKTLPEEWFHWERR